MRKRRLVSLLLAASLAASALAGCGSGGKTETTAAAAGGQTEAAGGTAGETGAAGGTSAADLGTPLADVRVRQALAYAIDMNALWTVCLRVRQRWLRALLLPVTG